MLISEEIVQDAHLIAFTIVKLNNVIAMDIKNGTNIETFAEMNVELMRNGRDRDALASMENTEKMADATIALIMLTLMLILMIAHAIMVLYGEKDNVFQTVESIKFLLQEEVVIVNQAIQDMMVSIVINANHGVIGM